MILLEDYIKEFLKEATSSIINPASDITGQSQHRQAASYNVNMTSIDNKDVLLKVLENVGDNCFISFVDKYDEKIPRLEVSPKVSYNTPHGNYAYPLTVKSLKDIVEKSSVGGANFALDRPYFHMFKKSNSVNSVEIQPDGRNNYTGNYKKDLRTIVHTAVMFNAARTLESNPGKYATKLKTGDEKREVKFSLLKRRIRSKIKANTKNHSERDHIFYETFKSLIEDLCYLVNLNDKKYPREIVELIVDFLTNAINLKIRSSQNKFFVRKSGEILSRLISKFHGLYFVCWMLSEMIINDKLTDDYDSMAFDVDNPQQDRLRRGSVFTMLLNSIDIDFINDRGSKTLHPSEPIQAVYLNSSKKEDVVLIGTFDNIFQITSSQDYEKTKEPHDPVTMNKIVDILNQNPQLKDLFGTELFDDVKLKHPLEDLREKAYADLTKKKIVFVNFLKFHSANKVFDLNIYVGKNKLIVFDIGIKEKFLNSSIEKQLKTIKREMPKIVKIEDSLTYIQVFLSKYRNKNIYEIKDKSGYDNIMRTLDKIQDHTANLEWNSLTNDEEKTSFMLVKTFINICEEISQLAGIASGQ